MKKYLLVLLLAATVQLSYGQFSFGIKAGGQWNQRMTKSEFNVDEWNRTLYSGIGFHVGGVADYRVGSHFSIQPNLLFNMSGIL